MWIGWWAILAALAVSGCERAEMEICRPLPRADDISTEAYYSLSSQPMSAQGPSGKKASTSQGQQQPNREAQRAIVTACLRRNAYLLTKSGASVSDIVNATTTKCDELITAEILTSVGNKDTFTEKMDQQGHEFYQRQAQAMVLEAKAGQCWAQGGWIP